MNKPRSTPQSDFSIIDCINADKTINVLLSFVISNSTYKFI